MKKIEAIIRPEKMDDVLAAISKMGYPGVMITEIQGHGKQRGLVQTWRGQQYKIDKLPKIKIEIVVGDQICQGMVQAISGAARTGEIGDGKIFVYNVEWCERIRTGETGEDAL